MLRRAFLPATAVLAALTAFALLGTWFTVRSPAAPVAARDDVDSRTVALRFYDAVNAAIRTGDLGQFEAIVAPGFVDRTGTFAPAADRAALARHLRSLHAGLPQAALVVETMVAEGDQVIARVEVAGVDRRSFAGMSQPVEATVWGAVDVLQVADGRIVERWNSAEGRALLESLGVAPLERMPSDSPIVLLERLTVQPGRSVEQLVGDGVQVILVAAGTLRGSIAPDSAFPALVATGSAAVGVPGEVRPGADLSLSGSDVLVVSPSTRYALRVEDAEPGEVLVVTLLGPDEAAAQSNRPDPAYATAATPAPATGVETARLAGGLRIALPAGTVAVAFGRLTLAPGAVLPSSRADGTLLLHVETGALHLDADGAALWVTSGIDGASTASADGVEVRLAAGDGATVPAGAVVRLRNAGAAPVEVLVAAIVPNDPLLRAR